MNIHEETWREQAEKRLTHIHNTAKKADSAVEESLRQLVLGVLQAKIEKAKREHILGPLIELGMKIPILIKPESKHAATLAQTAQSYRNDVKTRRSQLEEGERVLGDTIRLMNTIPLRQLLRDIMSHKPVSDILAELKTKPQRIYRVYPVNNVKPPADNLED